MRLEFIAGAGTAGDLMLFRVTLAEAHRGFHRWFACLFGKCLCPSRRPHSKEGLHCSKGIIRCFVVCRDPIVSERHATLSFMSLVGLFNNHMFTKHL